MSEIEQTSREVADTEMNAVKKGFEIVKDIWNAYERSAENTIEEYTSKIGGQPSEDFDALADRFKEVNKSLDELNNEKDVYFASHNRGLTFEEWSHKPEREALYKEREELLNKMANLAFRDAMMQKSLDEEGVLDLKKYLNAAAVEINNDTVDQWKKQSQVLIADEAPLDTTPLDVGIDSISTNDPDITAISDARTANARDHVLEIMESTKSADRDFADAADSINSLTEDIKDLTDTIERGDAVSGEFLKEVGIKMNEVDKIALKHPVMMSMALAKESCSDLKSAFDSTKVAREEYNAALKEFWDVTKSYAKEVSDPIKESVINNCERNVSKASNIFTGAVAGLNEAIDLSIEAIKNCVAKAEKEYIAFNDHHTGGMETKLEESRCKYQITKAKYNIRKIEKMCGLERGSKGPIPEDMDQKLGKKLEGYYKKIDKYSAKLEMLETIREENWHGEVPIDKFYEKIDKAFTPIDDAMYKMEAVADELENKGKIAWENIVKAVPEFVADVKKSPETVKSWIKEGASNLVKNVEKGMGVSIFLAHQAMQTIKKDSLNIAAKVMTGLEKLCDARERACENLIARIDDRKEKLKAYKEEKIEVATKFADIREREAIPYSNPALERTIEASRQAILENYSDARARAKHAVALNLYTRSKNIHDLKEAVAIKDEYFSSKVKNLIPSAIAAKDVIHTQKALGKAADKMDKAMIKMEAIQGVKNAIASGKGQIMGEINKLNEASKNITNDLENEGEERD